MIYDLVLVSDEPVSFRNHPSKNHLGQYLPLTQVSRQVREETTPLLYGQNVFEVKLRSIKVDEVEKVDEESVQQPLRQNKTPKMKMSLRQRKPISPVPEHLLWGDRYAAAWADIARPKQIAQVQQLAVTVVKADRNRNWNHLRHLSKSPSSLSQEHTGVFSARSWHLHAIELKCPGRHSVVWNLDCRENRSGDRRLNLYAKDLEDLYEPKPCSRCRLMLDGWRTQHNRQDGMSRALFLALVWYGIHGSPFTMLSETDIDMIGLPTQV